ncbi:hypothetical protein [Algoriphagus aquimarinus]|uniref:Uncharacterized protein n=1 Tax=Algoriphagus aquimarinus TaxID=237018 RepID=A0A5C7AQA8_9BACT|nr:hypothetical protein [Algoriphagus aquimarinus]TXE08042.1 hypothetical protein ESV85_15085 [Algoriphagus aquimarinus]
MKKAAVLESISKMNEEISIDEIVDRLLILEKIDKGRSQLSSGQSKTEEQAKQKLAKWLS